MTKLDNLLYSLATVIIRYHDSQSKVINLIPTHITDNLRKKFREYAVALLHDEKTPFTTRLEEIIEDCTTKIKYEDRQPLLSYLKHEITFLKALLDHNRSFQPELLAQYKEQIKTLLIDLRQLVNTRKSEEYKVRCSKIAGISEAGTANFSLSGLKNAKLSAGYAYCNSGYFILEEILNPLGLNEKSTDDEITVLAERLCTKHQNLLLSKEMIQENEQLKSELAKANTNLSVLQQNNLELKAQLKSAQDALKKDEVRLVVPGEALPAKTIFKPNPTSNLRYNPSLGFLGILQNTPNSSPPDSFRGMKTPGS